MLNARNRFMIISPCDVLAPYERALLYGSCCKEVRCVAATVRPRDLPPFKLMEMELSGDEKKPSSHPD
jgi:hypothetical protein